MIVLCACGHNVQVEDPSLWTRDHENSHEFMGNLRGLGVGSL